MNDIVITGSRGFLGTLIRKAIKQPYYEFDLQLGSDYRGLSGMSGTLIHLAAVILEDESYKNPSKYISQNILGLAQLLAQNSFEHVIFPSSSAVYDDQGNLEPDSVYGVTKLAGEKLIKLYAQKYWILRLGNPYGEDGNFGALPELKRCKKSGAVFPLYRSTGGIYKDFFPASCIPTIINMILADEINPGIYNVGSGVRTNVFKLLVNVCKRAGIPYVIIDTPKGLSNGFIPSTNLLKSESENVEEQWLKYLDTESITS